MGVVTVNFRGDTLFAVQEADGVRIALKSISDRLGLNWAGQLQRTKRDPVLAEGMCILPIPSPGGAQETATLPLNLLPGWLFGIGANQVKPEARDLVLAYQRECHDVLYRHFFGGRGPGHAPAVRHPAREESMRVRRQLVTEARHTFGERAAGSLWFELDMPVVPEMQGRPSQNDLFTYTAVPAPAAPPARRAQRLGDRADDADRGRPDRTR